MKTTILKTTLLVLAFWALGCSKEIGKLNINRQFENNIYIDSTKAGEVFDSLFTVKISEVKTIIQEKGSGNIDLQNLYLKSITFQIPDTFNYTFSDIESCVVTLDNDTIGILPANASGKSFNLTIPSQKLQDNLKTYYENNKDISFKSFIKAKNDIPQSHIIATTEFNIKADILISK
ncbi:MAG: hypothetical protein ACOYMA_08670 [Bacteroidia bacterium]